MFRSYRSSEIEAPITRHEVYGEANTEFLSWYEYFLSRTTFPTPVLKPGLDFTEENGVIKLIHDKDNSKT